MDGLGASGGRGRGSLTRPPLLDSPAPGRKSSPRGARAAFVLPLHAGMLEGNQLHPQPLAFMLVSHCRSLVSAVVFSQLGSWAPYPLERGCWGGGCCSEHTSSARPALHPVSAPQGGHTFSGSICPEGASWNHLSIYISHKGTIVLAGSLTHFSVVKVLVAQLCPTLCNPMGCHTPGSSVNGILQIRILEWVAVPFSRGSSQFRDQTQVSSTADRFFTI